MFRFGLMTTTWAIIGKSNVPLFMVTALWHLPLLFAMASAGAASAVVVSAEVVSAEVVSAAVSDTPIIWLGCAFCYSRDTMDIFHPDMGEVCGWQGEAVCRSLLDGQCQHIHHGVYPVRLLHPRPFSTRHSRHWDEGNLSAAQERDGELGDISNVAIPFVCSLTASLAACRRTFALVAVSYLAKTRRRSVWHFLCSYALNMTTCFVRSMTGCADYAVLLPLDKINIHRRCINRWCEFRNDESQRDGWRKPMTSLSCITPTSCKPTPSSWIWQIEL